jgi:hypothetical protein
MTLPQFFLKQKEAIRARSRDVFGMIRPENMGWKPENGALTIGELLRHLWVSEEGVRRCALDGDFSYYEIRVPKGLHAVMGSPGPLAVILFGINEHEIHHRAQLMTYLRMLGTPVALKLVKK